MCRVRHGETLVIIEAACAFSRLENEIRGLLKTFGVMFGKRVGGFKRRAEEILDKELSVVPELVPIFAALMQGKRCIYPMFQ